MMLSITTRPNSKKNLVIKNVVRPNIIGWYYLAFGHLAIMIVHIAIGSSFAPLLIMTSISLLGLSRLLRPAIWPSDTLVAALALYSGTISLVLKAVNVQPLQQNLVFPEYSTTLMALGFISFYFAAHLARKLSERRPNSRMFVIFSDVRFLKRIVLPITVLGLVLFVLHTIFRPRFQFETALEGPGFGGFGSFYFILILASCAASHLAFRTKSKIAWFFLISLGITLFLFAIFANTKREFADFILILVLTAFSLRIRVRLFQVLLLFCFVIIFQFFLYPVIHIMRDSFTSLSLLERISTAWALLIEVGFDPWRLAEINEQIASGLTYINRPGGTYLYPILSSADRFFLIQPIDVVAQGISNQIYSSPFTLWLELLEGILPSFIIGDKTSAIFADIVAWDYGIRGYGSIGRPVLGFTATALAVGGIPGVLLLNFLVGLPCLYFMNRAFGHLRSSVIGVQIILMSWYIVEQGVDSFIGFFFRTVLLMWVFNSILLHLFGRRSKAADQSLIGKG